MDARGAPTHRLPCFASSPAPRFIPPGLAYSSHPPRRNKAVITVGSRAAIDERDFETVRRIRQSHGGIPLSAFKALVREQFNILLVDTEAASKPFRRCCPGGGKAAPRLRSHQDN